MPDKFVSRLKEPIPNIECKIKIIIYNHEGEATTEVCEWNPYTPEKYPKEKKPTKGYLGTAVVTEGDYEGIGYHAWEKNNHEFLYYSLIED